MNYMMKCSEMECCDPHNFQMIQKHKHMQSEKERNTGRICQNRRIIEGWVHVVTVLSFQPFIIFETLNNFISVYSTEQRVGTSAHAPLSPFYSYDSRLPERDNWENWS